MIKHFVVMSSSYSKGTRIALDYVMGDSINPVELAEIVDRISDECGDSVSTHFVGTDREDWESVAEEDAYFKDVLKIDSLDEFIYLIKEDRVLIGLDIAKYILSVQKCTHLQLEKLVYLCYADYLCKSGKKLFDDRVYAFDLGPVVKSVYDKYKGTREIEDEKEVDDRYALLPVKSRILFAEDGVEKIASIEKTIEKYKGYSASDLVRLTHRPGSPWDLTDKTVRNSEITDEMIKANHAIEAA